MRRFTEYYFQEGLKGPLFIEGGAYGHLDHPFDDNDLSFAKMKNMISHVIHGKLKTVEEKTDGQNILVSWKNGHLVGARNKSHLKNIGENALDIKGIIDMFNGRGNIQKAFQFAMEDLQQAFAKLPKPTLDKIFENGKKFISFEVMYPATENVIPYGMSMLIPHEVIEYDLEGNPVGRDRESAKQLAQIIKDTNNHVQKIFQIRVPQNVQFKIPNTDNQETQFIHMVDEIKGELEDNSKIGDYKKEKWMQIIKEKANELKYELPKEVLDKLINRWAFEDKSTKINDIRKQIENKEFSEWVKQYESTELANKQKEIIRPLEILFLKLGASILKNMTNFLSTNRVEAAKQIVQRLQTKIKEIESSSDESAINTLKTELKRLEDIGGFESIVPSEGIVYMFGDKLYKLTGAFAPVNKILGIGRYQR